MKSNGKTVYSKLIRTRVVLQHSELSQYVPATYQLNRSRLLAMLKRYGMLYVKPNKGSRGIGVMRVEKQGKTYMYQRGVRSYTFSTFQAMFQSLQRQTASKRYLIQKGIHLLKHEGRPFDFRVMVQRNPTGQWEPTGVVARVAHPLKVVTNGSQGGTIYPAEDVLKPIAGEEITNKLLQKMDRLARLTGAQFARSYTDTNELGLDIAIDHKFTPWILEVNTRPDPCPFTKLENKDIIRKIIAYAEGYDRKYNLVCSKAKSAPKRKGSKP